MYLENAQKARREGKFKKALKLYKNTLQEYPNEASAYAGLGLTYAYLKNFDKAASMATKALHLDTKQPLAHIALAGVYHAKGKHELYKAEVEKAFKLDPYFYEIACNYAHMLISEKKIDEALPIFENMIEADPKKACPHYYLGFIYSQKNNYRAALKEYIIAFRAQPSFRLALLIPITIVNIYSPWSNIILTLFLSYWLLATVFTKIGAVIIGSIFLLLIASRGNLMLKDGKKGWAIFYLFAFVFLAYIFYSLYSNAQ